MSDVIIDRVNANFGYRAISRISMVQTLLTPLQPANSKPVLQLNRDRHDIWALDDKLKNVKSPELRAALRRLGSPINGLIDRPVDDPVDTDKTDRLGNGSKHGSD